MSYRNVLLRSIRYNALFFPVIEVFSAHDDRLAALVRRLADSCAVRCRSRGAWWLSSNTFSACTSRFATWRRNTTSCKPPWLRRSAFLRFLDTTETIKNPPRPQTRRKSSPATVEFKNVWLSYLPGDPVLKGISFHVRPGEKVALVGATGGGKTSIISALCRFYEIERGAILVDGIDIREWNKQELRRHLGLVLQDVFLFSGDIATNITLGDPRIRETEMVERRRGARISRRSSKNCRTAIHEEVQERGATFLPRAAAIACLLPGLSPSTRRSSFSTRRPARSIPRPRC